MDSNTQVSDLLANAEFVKLAKLEVPAKNLTEYAPDRSLRWLQEACKTARELETAPIGATLEGPVETMEWVVPWSNVKTAMNDEPVKMVYIPEWAEPIVGPKSFKVPTIDLPSATNWWSLDGDYALLSDVHIPFYHAPTLERLMTDSDKVGVRKLIIMGDLFDFNQFNHKRGSLYQRRAQDDVEAGRPVLKALLECYERIYVFMGNHDDWMSNSMRNQFGSDWLFSKFFNDMPQVKWSKYGQCDVHSGGVKWKLLHGAQFSGANPLGVAKNHASKFLCNVVVGHQHRVEEGYDSSGRFRCICLGGSYDPDKMHYLTMQPYSSGTSKRSVGILKEGEVLHIQDV